MTAESETPTTFEEQLAHLEQLVRQLEGDSLPLEEGVKRYQEGVRLLKALNASLSSAEHRVEELTGDLRRELAQLEEDVDQPDADDA